MSPQIATRPLESAVWAALHDVRDPEIPAISVVDLGVVRRVEAEEGRVRIELLPTFVGCPAIDVMRDAVAQRLAEFADDVSVEVSFAEPWTSQRITPEGRDALRRSGFGPPPAHAVVDGRTLPVLRLARHHAGERLRPNAVSRDLSLLRLQAALRAVQNRLMRSREGWSALLAGAATIWLVVAFWLALTNEMSGIDRIAVGLALAMQLSVLLAWDLFPRLPLWIVAGHGLIMVSLALGLIITAPAGAPPTFGLAMPWYVLGLVPAGLAMILAAAARWQRSSGLAH